MRQLLSLIASVFDQLGLVAPAAVILKIILQEVWRTGVSWDKNLPITFQKRIQKWLHESSKSDRVSLPRCMQVLPTNSLTELHVFTDASQLALGTVAYLRMPQSTAILAFFVMGRSKIEPKQQSIPRLELDAAVLGVRLSEFIQSSFCIPLSSVTFWTDSTTVLAWIKSDSKQKTYVSHRIKEILEKQNLNCGIMYQVPPIQLIMPLAALKRKTSKNSGFHVHRSCCYHKKSGFSKTLRHTKRTFVQHPKSSNL